MLLYMLISVTIFENSSLNNKLMTCFDSVQIIGLTLEKTYTFEI